MSTKNRPTAVKHTYDAPTPKQIAYAEALAAAAGYRFLNDAVKDCFGKNPVGGIKREKMSQLITFLQAR